MPLAGIKNQNYKSQVVVLGTSVGNHVTKTSSVSKNTMKEASTVLHKDAMILQGQQINVNQTLECQRFQESLSEANNCQKNIPKIEGDTPTLTIRHNIILFFLRKMLQVTLDLMCSHGNLGIVQGAALDSSGSNVETGGFVAQHHLVRRVF